MAWGKAETDCPHFCGFCCLAAGKSRCGGMDLLPRYRDPIPSGSGGRQRTLPEPDDGSFQSSNSILYGHNMQDDSMFGTLEYYEEQAYFAAHPVLYLLTPEVDYEVQLLAGLHVPLDDEIYETDWTEWDLQDYLRDIIERSDFDSGASYTDAERILTLSTCGAGSRDTRYVLIGAMTELDRRETPRVAAE